MSATAPPKILLDLQDPWRRRGLSQWLVTRDVSLVTTSPDIAVTDVTGPPQAAYDRIAQTRRTWPKAAVVAMVPELRVAFALSCLGAGATGLLPFDTDEATLIAAIVTVHRGDVWASRALMAKAISRISWTTTTASTAGARLTPAEEKIAALLCEHRTNCEISDATQTSLATVKFHVANILRKTGCYSRNDPRLLTRDSS